MLNSRLLRTRHGLTCTWHRLAGPDTGLPLTRVKRIMRLDKEVRHTSGDACKTIAKATELFIESLVEGSFVAGPRPRRRLPHYCTRSRARVARPRRRMRRVCMEHLHAISEQS